MSYQWIRGRWRAEGESVKVVKPKVTRVRRIKKVLPKEGRLRRLKIDSYLRELKRLEERKRRLKIRGEVHRRIEEMETFIKSRIQWNLDRLVQLTR